MNNVPKISQQEIDSHLGTAEKSPRRRHPLILHKQGDEFNQVFNFLMTDTYMQPHLHPGEEKIEKMYLVQGSFAVIFFDDNGKIIKVEVLEKGKKESIEIPAFSWHTYVMLTEKVVSYETMMGKYDPKTWKTLAEWAPTEDSKESKEYLNSLKKFVLNNQ